MSEPDPRDLDYTEHVITEVHQYEDGRYEIGYGMFYAYAATDGVAPQVGETVRIYTGLTPGSVRGLVVGGRVYVYETKAEVKAKDAALRERLDAEACKRLPEYDARYAALPEAFQRRLDYFRDRNPRFRLDLEGPELQLCELAVRLANECGSAEAVEHFQALSYEEQCRQRPWLIDHRESASALQVVGELAYWWLIAPTRLSEVPGALEHISGNGYGRESTPGIIISAPPKE